MTIAIHKVFDSPKDKIIFDVGHQTYTHKILTGRVNEFKDSLRKHNGLSGYQKLDESEYDFIEAGHSSTSISIASGIDCISSIHGNTAIVIYNVCNAVINIRITWDVRIRIF